MIKTKIPDISVIIAGYNCANTIIGTLKSIQQQTYENIEIIFVNDGSDDDTDKIVSKIAKQDKRIKYLKNDKNKGVSVSRNLGIKQAQAEYIMFCDADDFFAPEICAKMLSSIRKYQTDVVVCELEVTYEAHQEMQFSDSNYYSLKFAGRQDMRDEIILNTDFAPVNKLFKRKIIEQNSVYYPEGLFFEDAFFCAAYFCCCKDAYFLNEKLYNYIRRPHSTMSDIWSNLVEKDYAIDHLQIAFRLYDFLKKQKLLNQYNSLYWQLFFDFEEFALRNSKSSAARKIVRAAAKEFIDNHAESFQKISRDAQARVKRLNMRGPNFGGAGVKRRLIRMMPIYRLEVDNIERLRHLKGQAKQLNESLKG